MKKQSIHSNIQTAPPSFATNGKMLVEISTPQTDLNTMSRKGI